MKYDYYYDFVCLPKQQQQRISQHKSTEQRWHRLPTMSNALISIFSPVFSFIRSIRRMVRLHPINNTMARRYLLSPFASINFIHILYSANAHFCVHEINIFHILVGMEWEMSAWTTLRLCSPSSSFRLHFKHEWQQSINYIQRLSHIPIHRDVTQTMHSQLKPNASQPVEWAGTMQEVALNDFGWTTNYCFIRWKLFYKFSEFNVCFFLPCLPLGIQQFNSEFPIELWLPFTFNSI